MGKQIITIGREYGSGGRYVGKMLASKLGVAFYDKAFINIMVEKYGYSPEFIAKNSEEISNFSLMGSVAISSSFSQYMPPQTDELFLIQSKIIKEAAENGPCVIVGRCADYILRAREDCLNVFLYTSIENKINRAVKYYNLPEQTAEKQIIQKDKTRAKYYKHYTNKVWGLADNYHLSLDSDFFGVENCVDIIANLATY